MTLADRIANLVFLALCFGVPPVLLVAVLVQVYRAIFSTGLTEKAARAKGWSYERTPTHVKLAGTVDGAAWCAERAHPRRRHRSPPLVWSAPCPPCEGLFVVQRRPPILVRGFASGVIASPLLTSLTGLVIDRVSRDALASLRELKGPDGPAPSPIAVYRSSPGHAAEPAADALRELIESWPARELGPLVLWIERDRLYVKLDHRRERIEDVEALVALGVRACAAVVGTRGGDYRAG